MSSLYGIFFAGDLEQSAYFYQEYEFSQIMQTIFIQYCYNFFYYSFVTKWKSFLLSCLIYLPYLNDFASVLCHI